MAKHGHTPGRHRPKSGGSLGRLEQPTEDDRPFAEIRRNLHNVLGMLVLHRWAFFVPGSLVASAVFILSLYYPRTYRATTSFERRNDPVMMNLPLSAGAASFMQFRNTLARDLTSVEYLGEVADRLGLTKDLERNEDGSWTKGSQRRRDALARSLAAKLKVSSVSPSEQLDVIEITYTGSDPALGKRLVDEAKRAYIRRTKKATYKYLTDQRDFFVREAREAQEELKQARWEETRFRMENPYADPTNPGGISLKLAQREMERRELDLRKREYESELSALQQLLAATEPLGAPQSAVENPGRTRPPSAVESPEQLRLREQIRRIDDEVDDRLNVRGMTAEHPDVKQLLARRRRLENELARRSQADAAASGDSSSATPSSGRGTAGDSSIRSERARLLVQIAAQKAKLKDLQISLGTNERVTAELREAKRAVYEKQEEFAEIMEKVAKIRQKYSQREQTVAMIEPAISAFEKGKLLLFSEGAPARGSARPVSPRALYLVMLALLAGLATGVVGVVVTEIFDHVYRSSSQVARSLQLPMLASIDEIVTAKDRRSVFLRRMVVAPLVVVCFAGLTGIAGSMAYLSIERPWAYEKISRIPQAVIHLLARG